MTYSYDIMVKANPDWLRQVTDDLILNGYLNNIIKNPEVLGTVLKDKQKRAFQSKPLLQQRRVRACARVLWGRYLEQGVVLEERADDLVGVFGSLLQNRGDLDSDGWLCRCILCELEKKTDK